jgi:FkbM family methyltransferase
MVHALEAFPANVDRLRAHLRLNGITWVRSHTVAVGAAPGQASFVQPPDDNFGVGSLARVGEEANYRVAVTTLDGFRDEQRLARIDVLKIDVEGGEQLVLQGAKGLLASLEAPIIMFEVCDTLARRFGTSCAEIKDLLETAGYSIYRFDGDRLRRVATSAMHPVSEDLFAIRSRHVRDRPVLQDLIE